MPRRQLLDCLEKFGRRDLADDLVYVRLGHLIDCSCSLSKKNPAALERKAAVKSAALRSAVEATSYVGSGAARHGAPRQRGATFHPSVTSPDQARYATGIAIARAITAAV